ncbi:carotenoid 9,10(9',10')-cleavage dioxygenase 1 [Cannabis sativa]|uniref:carotenoid 9,10(9',10')-cleavage dioxygenase 1 n=1 Tax=Cannabis sativa TaxID=3483 RepID=UPI0029C9CF7B|nr:carotenoid 9,10(9',10')-cleavage dioxygenase 1 [Cannabis sativa]
MYDIKQPLYGALVEKGANNIMIRIEHVMKNTSIKILDAFVDSMFEIIDQPLLPSQKNFEPVEDELGEAVVITTIQGNIPNNFPQGVYIRNGPNPLHGGLKSTKSIFGKSNHIWVEGEGMLHALYFTKVLKLDDEYYWSVNYNNRHVKTETFTLEKLRNKPSFLPAIGGDSLAVLSAYLLNLMRFGKVNKYISNTNVFEHCGKVYSIAENHMPQEIDIFTLQTLAHWHLSPTWNRPFTSHPKRVACSGELVTIGIAPTKPYVEIGVISADGKKLIHRADLKLKRCPICHDIGITKRYNLIMDIPLTIDIMRLVRGGPLIKYDKDEYARIGVMPRYGDADSIKWFEVEPNCTMHFFNCFEDGDDEIVVWGCRALDSIISSTQEQIDTPTTNANNSYHDSPYEWRLNMKNGIIKEKKLTLDSEYSMDYPTINENYIGLKNKFGYAQVVDPISATTSNNLLKYCGIAKLHFEDGESKEMVKIEYHMFEKNTFCSGATFVSNDKKECVDEDDGWIITFVHNEDTNISQVLLIDSKNFSSEPVAKITLPYRVPYGFHGTFVSM